MIRNSRKSSPKAFSLIELSVVILIISILITGILSVSVSGVQNAKTKVTRDRMDQIYIALANYVAVNKTFPCPAAINKSKGAANYGDAATNGPTCSTYGGVTSSGDLVYGMVPVNDLGLSEEMAEDGFGSKFGYVVDDRLTVASTFDNGFTSSDADGYQPITVTQKPANTTISADFLIISHGANRYGSYPANSTSTISTTGADADELVNDQSGYTASFTSISTSSDIFDDIIKIGVLTNLISEFQLYSVIQCKYSGYTDWDYKGVSACASSQTRICHAFGQSTVQSAC